MDFAMITPPDLIQLSGMLPHSMVIAPWALNNKNYRRAAAFQPAAESRLVILDNGTFEGQPVPAEQLLMLVEEIQPDVVIAPDTLYDPDWQAAVPKALEFQTDVESYSARTKTMFVPQCEKPTDAWAALQAGCDAFQWIGICRDFCKLAVGRFLPHASQESLRLAFTYELQARDFVAPGQVHNSWWYLGVGDPIENVENYWFVTGMDSASFFWKPLGYNRRPRNFALCNTLRDLKAVDAIAQHCQAMDKHAQVATELRKHLEGGRL